MSLDKRDGENTCNRETKASVNMYVHKGNAEAIFRQVPLLFTSFGWNKYYDEPGGRKRRNGGYLEEEEVSAVVLQIGHQLFIRNHSCTHFKWYACSQCSLPTSSPIVYSSWKPKKIRVWRYHPYQFYIHCHDHHQWNACNHQSIKKKRQTWQMLHFASSLWSLEGFIR